jgi:hypothetical protein
MWLFMRHSRHVWGFSEKAALGSGSCLGKHSAGRNPARQLTTDSTKSNRLSSLSFRPSREQSIAHTPAPDPAPYPRESARRTAESRIAPVICAAAANATAPVPTSAASAPTCTAVLCPGSKKRASPRLAP